MSVKGGPGGIGPRSLGGTVARGVGWLFAQNVSARLLALASQVALARLLIPSDFGLFGLAGTVIGIVGMVSDCGVQDVVIHRDKAVRLWITPAFWASVLVGAASFVIVICIAPIAAKLYAAPGLPRMLGIMAVSLPITALGAVPTILLRASLRFRQLALYGTAEVVATQVLTVILAWRHFGVYSFIFPIPVIAAARLTVLWVVTRPRVGRPRIRPMWLIIVRGTTLLGTKLVTAAVNQGDYFVLGLVASKSVVGAYYFGFRMAVQPLQLLAGSVTNVVFPVLTRMGDDRSRQRAAALNASRVLADLAMPCCFLQAALAEPLVHLLAGRRWEGSVPVVQLLSIGLGFDAVSWIAGALLKARGQFFRTFKYITLCAVAFFTVVSVGACVGHNKATSVAIGVAIYYALVTPVYSIMTFRDLGVSAGEVVGLYLRPALLSAAAVVLATVAVRGWASEPVARICATTGVALLIYLGSLRWFAPATLRTMVAFARSALVKRTLAEEIP